MESSQGEPMTNATAVREWRLRSDRLQNHPFASMAAALRRILDQARYPELRIAISPELRLYATAHAILEAKLAALAEEFAEDR